MVPNWIRPDKQDMTVHIFIFILEICYIQTHHIKYFLLKNCSPRIASLWTMNNIYCNDIHIKSNIYAVLAEKMYVIIAR